MSANGQLKPSELSLIQGNHAMASYAARQFRSMDVGWQRSSAFKKAKEAGKKPRRLQVNSAYRTRELQEKLFRQNYSTTPTKNHYKWWNGKKWYLKNGGVNTAPPGSSNHGSGISVDINLTGPDAAAQAWLRANAGKYGFVEDVAGEPWHWTYKKTPQIVDQQGRRRLYKGLEHAHVKIAQRAYNNLVKRGVIKGELLTVDGNFGGKTEAAIRKLNAWGKRTDSPHLIDKDYKWAIVDQALAYKPAEVIIPERPPVAIIPDNGIALPEDVPPTEQPSDPEETPEPIEDVEYPAEDTDFDPIGVPGRPTVPATPGRVFVATIIGLVVAVVATALSTLFGG